MSRLLVLFFLFFLSLSVALAQEIHFDVLRGDDKLGDIYVEREVKEDTVRLEVNSSVKFNVFFSDYTRNTHILSRFVSDEMTYSKTRVTQNDNLKRHRVCKRKGTAVYECVRKKGKKKKDLNEVIYFNSSMLYFEEPKDVSRLFSESYLKMCKVKDLGGHSYKVQLTDDKVNKYFYKGGKLNKVKVIRSFFTITFERT